MQTVSTVTTVHHFINTLLTTSVYKPPRIKHRQTGNDLTRIELKIHVHRVHAFPACISSLLTMHIL